MFDEHESPIETPDRRRIPPGIPLLGLFALLATVTLLAALAVILWPAGEDAESPVPQRSPTAVPSAEPLGIAAVEYVTPVPTSTPVPTVDWVHPTAAADEIAAALDAPLPVAWADGAIQREPEPFTIQPARARSDVITYLVQKGDNLRSISDKFGIDQSTIIWSNDRFYVNAMRIGLELNILPVNGVYHRVIDPQTVAEVAEAYAVEPYAIIDSEFNDLFGAGPDTILPSGLYVIVPGGTGNTEPVYWDPGIEITSDSTASGAAVAQNYASFGVGDPGSCGRQAVVGGSPPYSAPIRRDYRITQDYTWNHGGIDLAVPVGTGVFAAGGGTVIFAGWSNWGYGYTVVIAHGSTLSIYGHLNGPLVSCGQAVVAGEGIAVTGSSGNSSGPHLHFEIRGSDGRPTSPWNYQSF